MHPYVLDNERAVEIPIALAALDDAIESARRDDAKALRAFQHLPTLLAPGGRGSVTFLWGYHPELDIAVRDGAFEGAELAYLKRCDRFWNRWQQTSADGVLRRRYGPRFRVRTV